MPLALEADPVVESWTRRVIHVSHVPLADEASFVTRVLQILWKEKRTIWNEPLVIDDAVSKGVKSSENRGSTGRTKRSCDECIFEMDAVFGHLVQIGSFQKWMPHHAERIPSMVVAQNKNDVGR